MSHPVFLSSSALPRMPEGSRNEWRGFFGHGGELEANAFFPLLWRALFGADDIRHARFIDEYDIDDEAAAADRAECLEHFGAEATYPYLVTDKRTALARLASRREAILAAVGERYRPIFDCFAELIAHGFADHLLLRTSGPGIGLGRGERVGKLADALLQEAGVACLAGPSFGPMGEGYIRFSIANSLENLNQALERINGWVNKNL